MITLLSVFAVSQAATVAQTAKRTKKATKFAINFDVPEVPYTCTWKQDGHFYNFYDQNATAFHAKTDDGNTTISYSLCGHLNATVSPPEACPDSTSYALIGNSKCTALSESNPDSISLLSNYTSTDVNGTSSGLALQYRNTLTRCGLKVGLICSKDPELGKHEYIQGPLTQVGRCNYETYQTSKKNCGVFDRALSAFFMKFKGLFGTIAIFMGFFLAWFGKKCVSVTLFTTGLFATIVLALVCYTLADFILMFKVGKCLACLGWLLQNKDCQDCTAIIDRYNNFKTLQEGPWLTWTVLATASLAGILIGLCLMKCKRLGVSILAGQGGLIMGLFFLTLFGATNGWVFSLVAMSFGTAGVAVSLCYFNETIIYMTSFFGSFLFFRGISLFAGGWPSEFSDEGIQWWYYLYLTAITFFTIVCSRVQLAGWNKEEAEQKAKKDKIRNDLEFQSKTRRGAEPEPTNNMVSNTDYQPMKEPNAIN